MKKLTYLKLLIIFCTVIAILFLVINNYSKKPPSKNQVSAKQNKSVVNPINFKIIDIEIYKGSMLKKINAKDDIDKIVNFLNYINYHDANSIPNDDWNYLIRIGTIKKNLNITFYDNKVQYINGNYYELDKKTLANLGQIYDELQYEEIRAIENRN